MSRAIWKRERGLDPRLTAALEETGLPWNIEIGSKHRKIMLAGKLVGVVPIKGTGDGDCRNVATAIRRAARAGQ